MAETSGSEVRASELRILMESKCGSKFMIFRIFGRKAGGRFVLDAL
jgi:hypothetical protein